MQRNVSILLTFDETSKMLAIHFLMKQARCLKYFVCIARLKFMPSNSKKNAQIFYEQALKFCIISKYFTFVLSAGRNHIFGLAGVNIKTN